MRWQVSKVPMSVAQYNFMFSLREEIAKLLLAVQFLTRIPIPRTILFSEERFSDTPRYYPAVGMLIGAICVAICYLNLQLFTPPLAITITVALGVLLTGAFHEDGLADTFDGIGGGQTRDDALLIMRDSRLGTYGTLAILFVLTIKIMAMSTLPINLLLLSFIAAHGLSRLSSVIVMATSQYARDHGTGKPVSGGITTTSLCIALFSGIICLLLLLIAAPPNALGFAVIGLLIGHYAVRRFYANKIGGYTGDTLGAVQQASELGFYLGLAAWA